MVLFLMVLTAVLAAGCSDGPETVVSVTPAIRPSPAATASTAVPEEDSRPEEQATAPAEGSRLEEQATTPAPTPEPDDYSSTAIMYAIIPDAIYATGTGALNEALAEISAHGDVSQVSVLVESLGYFGGSARSSIVEVLRELTGLDHGASPSRWKEWLGNNLSEYEPPEGYADWKAGVFALTDDRFAEFLDDPENTARIDLREVVFGGVSPDGIPDLQSPKTVTAEEADYLYADERVFGVSINGEHRAYPLRIVNPHEMVNDSLGGEPFVLMW
jgi:hypothetical protein